MSHMPSAREHALHDLRRKRSGVLAGLVFALSFGVYFLSSSAWSLALVLAALLASLALPSWVGVEPRYPIPTLWREMWGYVSALALPAVGLVLIYTVWSKGQIENLSLAPVVVIAAVVYAVYRWGRLTEALARVRGDGVGMPLLARLWRHYLGYLAGFAAGGFAVFAIDVREWPLSLSVFVASLLIVKSMVDLALPQPPLPSQRLSTTFFALALMSPVWFGLPWGVALTVASVLFDLSLDMSLSEAVDDSAMVVGYVTAASGAVFVALATAAFGWELATGEG